MTSASLIVVFAVNPTFAVGLALLFLIGSTQAMFNVTSQSTLQYLVPNDFRVGIWGMTHTAVQPLGQLQMGVLVGVFSAPIAVAAGGLAMLVYAAVLVLPNARVRNLMVAVDEHDAAASLVRLRH